MNFNRVLTNMSFYYLYFYQALQNIQIDRYFKKALSMVNYYTAARKNTYTKNCYNMKCLLNMTSLAQNLFFLLKVFYSMSSNPVNKRGRVAPDVASRSSLTIPFRKVISRKHLKQSFARRVIFYHTLATSSHLEGLDVAVFF